MYFKKEHFKEEDSFMFLLFTPVEFISIGGHTVMNEVKNALIKKLDEKNYDLNHFQLRYMPRYKDILIFVSKENIMVEEEEEVEKELLHFFQTFKNEYLFSDGRDNIGNVRRVLPVPIEEQPPLD